MSQDMDPRVLEYIRRKKAGQDQIAQAQDVERNVGYADIAGQIGTDIANSQRNDVILANRMQDLGKDPNIVAAEKLKFKGAAEDASKATARVQEAADTDLKQYQTEVALGDQAAQKNWQGKVQGRQEQTWDYEDKARQAEIDKSDPNSQRSQAARQFYSQTNPQIAVKIEGMSAADLEKALPILGKAEDRAWKQQFQQGLMDYRKKGQEENARHNKAMEGLAGRPKAAAPGTESNKAVLAATRMADAEKNGIASVSSEALDKLSRQKSLEALGIGSFNIGTLADLGRRGPVTSALTPADQKSVAAMNQWIDAYVQYTSGAAFSKEELALKAAAYLPAAGDSAEVRTQKQQMRDKFTATAAKLGNLTPAQATAIVEYGPDAAAGPANGDETVESPQKALKAYDVETLDDVDNLP